jgi:hypothetical protein
VRLPISPLPRSSHSLAKDFELGMGYLTNAWTGADYLQSVSWDP